MNEAFYGACGRVENAKWPFLKNEADVLGVDESRKAAETSVAARGSCPPAYGYQTPYHDGGQVLPEIVKPQPRCL